MIRAAGIPASLLVLALLSHCGGGYKGPSSPGSSSPLPVQVSRASPMTATCGGTAPTGTTETYTSGSAVQPQLAVIPGGALVGVWEQDRWSGLGARAILSAHSTDNGATWSTPAVLPFSNCGGGNGPGVQYDRASDPWVTFAGSGVLVASAIAFSANGYTAGGFIGPGGLSGVLASRSTDGGATWSTPSAVLQDTNPGSATAQFFNDRDSITADSSGNVYLVWDRLTDGTNASGVLNSAPAWLATSTDAGQTWSAARVLYDPGQGNEAFNNEIAILPNGRLLDFFTLVSLTTSSTPTVLQVVSSADHGATWSTSPVTVATIVSNGTPDPIAAGPSIRDSPFIAQVAVDPATGNVAAVWQQAFNGNTSFDGIALSVSKDGGATWSAPVQINGAPAAAAFTPTVRYLPGSVLAVTYYDLRGYAPGSAVLSTGAWLTESSDGGATWHEIEFHGPFDLSKAPLTNQNRSFAIGSALFLGDNQGLGLVGSSALPLYGATNGSGAHVFAAQPPDPLTSPSAHGY